ncbi:Por secretion system C-terminal sorting domain-containing protein [Hymenobacter actinosclerus]|uniref:Por secretion system C-terminal sorting domain-containing protein n=2 Tax=Hymenobacter actinosclerus TaxID=82805 RepID=A0A1I0IMQ7_9BACT|nr:Por secretion system C-terminal sorting domain-containing protein [Hymenobacter actinosclerus]
MLQFSTPFASKQALRLSLATLLLSGGLLAGARAQSFAPPRLLAVQASPQGVAVADLNGDARPDLVVSCSYANTVNVLLNQPGAAGGFAPAVSYPIGAYPLRVVAADVNGDGYPDMVAALQQGGGVAVMLNSTLRPGTFLPAEFYSTLGDPRSLAVGDVNGDGHPDIVALDTEQGEAAVLLNSATAPGTFPARATVFATGGRNAVGVALADVNADGWADLVVCGGGSGRIGVLLNRASTPGTFGPVVTYSSGASYPQDLAVGDVNADGRPDIVVATGNDGRVAVLLNAAGTPGTFAPPVLSAAAGRRGVYSVELGDINGDKLPDIVTGNREFLPADSRVGVLVNSATTPGSFPLTATEFDSGGGSTHDVALGDLNGDGRLDVALVDYIGGKAAVLLNTGTFLSAATAAGTARVRPYPNPAREYLTLELAAFSAARNVQVELVNALGQVVRRLQLDRPAAAPDLRIDTAALPAGVYTLHVRGLSVRASARVVIE